MALGGVGRAAFSTELTGCAPCRGSGTIIKSHLRAAWVLTSSLLHPPSIQPRAEQRGRRRGPFLPLSLSLPMAGPREGPFSQPQFPGPRKCSDDTHLLEGFGSGECFANGMYDFMAHSHPPVLLRSKQKDVEIALMLHVGEMKTCSLLASSEKARRKSAWITWGGSELQGVPRVSACADHSPICAAS